MICPRCYGVSVFRAIGEEPEGAGRWMKCMSCCHRWDAEAPSPVARPARTAEEDLLQEEWTMTTTKCKRCQLPSVAGQTLCEDHCRRLREYMKNYRARKNGHPPGETPPESVPRETKAMVPAKVKVKVKIVEDTVLNQIDEEIEVREQELDALRKAREILGAGR